MSRAEWREAMQIYRQRVRKPIATGMMWACIMVPLCGATADMVRSLRKAHLPLQGSIFSVLVLLVCFLALGALLRRELQLRRDIDEFGLPDVQWEMTLQEEGLRRTPIRTDDAYLEIPVHYQWDDFQSARVGPHVLVLVRADGKGVEALPLRALTEEQLGWVRRLLMRKVRPPSAAERRPSERNRDLLRM